MAEPHVIAQDVPCEEAPGRFCAYAADDGPRMLHSTPDAKSFVEAAILFTEVWHPPADAQGEVAVIVIDKETGRQRCYSVDVGHGEAAPCD
jgi:hypothetical protein